LLAYRSPTEVRMNLPATIPVRPALAIAGFKDVYQVPRV
jgi:hypothetical protein